MVHAHYMLEILQVSLTPLEATGTVQLSAFDHNYQNNNLLPFKKMSTFGIIQ